MREWSGIALLIVFLVCTYGADTQCMAKEIPLLIFAGQSNALNQGTDASTLPPPLAEPQTNVFFYNAYAYGRAIPAAHWEIYQPHSDETAANRAIFSQEITAAQFISQQLFGGGPVAVFKCAIGSTSIDEQWNPDLPESYFWQMKGWLIDSLARMPGETGYKGKIAGVFWTQGEDDAGDPLVAARYGQNLSNFIAQIRIEMGNERLPFVLAMLLPQWPNASTIRSNQLAMAKLFTDLRVVNPDDLPAPNYHYDNAGTIELGNRYGRAFVNIINARQGPQLKPLGAGLLEVSLGGPAGERHHLDYSPDLKQWLGATNAYVGANLFFQSVIPWTNDAAMGFMRVRPWFPAPAKNMR